MKNLIDFINESLQINESLNCSILNEINDQLKGVLKKDKEDEEKAKADAASRGSTYWYARQNGRTFKQLLGKFTMSIAWDKVKDEDFDKYTDMDVAGKMIRRMVSERSTTFSGIAFLKRKNDDDKMFFSGAIYKLHFNAGYLSFMSRYQDESKVRPSDVDYTLRNIEEVYILDLSKHTELNMDSKRMERASSQSGMFTPGDKDYYNKVAKDNRERYKQIVAKNKAAREANDGITEKVNEYTTKVLELSSKFSSNPIKYASFEYEVGYLIDTISDKKTYSSNRGRFTSSGSDGLLTLYSKYLKTKLALSKGSSYDFERKEYEDVKNALQKKFDGIDNKIKNLEEKMAA